MGVGGSDQHQIASVGVLCDHIAVDELSGVVAVGGVVGLVAQTGEVVLVDAEPAGLDDRGVEGLAAVQALAAQTNGLGLGIVLIAQVQNDIDLGLVAGVVSQNDGELAAKAGDVIGLGEELAGGIVDLVLAHDDAIGAQEDQSCDVVLLHDLQSQVGALILEGQALLQLVLVDKLRIGGVDGCGECPAIVDDIIAVVQPSVHAVLDLGAVGQLVALGIHTVPDLAVLNSQPGGDDLTIVGVEVGLAEVAALKEEVLLTASGVGDGEGHVLGVAHLTEVDLSQRIGVGECAVLLAALAVAEVGVLTQLGVVGESDAGIQAVVDGIVKQRSVGPVAVEADDGHDQRGSLGALCVLNDLVGVQITLHIDTVGEVVEVCLVVLGQSQSGIQGNGLVCANDDFVDIQSDQSVHVGCGVQTGAVVGDDLCIGGGQEAVIVDVQILVAGIVLTQRSHACHMQQHGAGVGGGDHAVVVEVVSEHGLAGGGSADNDLTLQSVGGVGDEVTIADCLGHDGAVELIDQSSVGEVADLEGELVDTGAQGIIAQLGLGTTLVRAGIGEVSGGSGSADEVSKTCTLISGGVGQQIGEHNGICGAHQQVCSQSALLGAGDLGVVLIQILDQDCHSAGDLRSSHGGTAHDTVEGTGDVGVDGGVDIAANAGDLGLELQIGGNAPGGEGAHGAVGLDDLDIAVADLQGADAALAGGLDHVLTGLAGDGDAGDILGSVIDLHTEVAQSIVVNHAADGTVLLSELLLLGEGGDAAGDQSDLAGHIDVCVVSFLAVAGNDHILEGLVDEVAQEDDFAGSSGIVEGDILAVNGEVDGLHTIVVGGGNCQSSGVGTGGACQTVIGVGDQGHIQTPHIHVGVVGIVTAGDQHLNIAVQEVVHSLQHSGIVVGKAGCSTQGQVGSVDLQTDAVLQSGHDGGPVCAAAHVEDLHNDHLSVGSDTDDIAAFDLVCCGDTGNMGTVVAAGVSIADIKVARRVVEREGDLGALVAGVDEVGTLGSAQGLPDLLNALTGHGIDQNILGKRGEVGVVDVQAGIQDSNAHTLTGVAAAVKDIGADHGGSVVGHRLEIDLNILGQGEGGGDINGGNTAHALQQFLVAVLGGDGETGGGDGVSEADLGLTAQHGANAVCHAVDGSELQLFLLANLCAACCDLADGEHLQQGTLGSDDDEGHAVLGAVLYCSVGLGEAGQIRGLELGQSGVLNAATDGILPVFCIIDGEIHIGGLNAHIGACAGSQGQGAVGVGGGSGAIDGEAALCCHTDGGAADDHHQREKQG